MMKTKRYIYDNFYKDLDSIMEKVYSKGFSDGLHLSEKDKVILGIKILKEFDEGRKVFEEGRPLTSG